MFNTKKPIPEPQRALPPVQPVTQRYSEQAAQAAQHMLNLEQQIEEYVSNVRQLQSQNSSLQSQLTDARSELLHSRDECDHYRRRCIEMETRLRTSAEILVETLKIATPAPVAPKDDPHDPPPLEDIEGQIHDLIKGGR